MFRLISSVDAKILIASLIDGCGLYLAANIVALTAGIQSRSYAERIGGLVESGGFTRVIFPLANSIQLAPAVASIYIAAVPFVILETGQFRRAMRATGLIASAAVLYASGSRGAAAISAILLILAASAPWITRWLAPVATVLAATTPAIRPWISEGVSLLLTPLSFLTPGRVSDAQTIESLQGRALIWTRSIDYWSAWVNDLPHIALGYGVSGQYRSGASLSYAPLLEGTVRQVERTSVHNAYLQQIFDAGLIGWLLLLIATLWASTRLATKILAWGSYGMAASLALTAILLGSMTETWAAPGQASIVFWVFMLIAGISCQTADDKSREEMPSTQETARAVTSP